MHWSLPEQKGKEWGYVLTAAVMTQEGGLFLVGQGVEVTQEPFQEAERT